MVSNSAQLDRRTKQHTQFGVSASNGYRDMGRTKSWRKKNEHRQSHIASPTGIANYIRIKRKLSLYDKTWFNLISLSSFGTVGRYVRDIKILGYQQLQFGIYHYFIFSGEFEYRIARWSSIICRRNETKRCTLVNTKIASNMKIFFR